MHKKKLIEVALPLEAINKASAREKSIRHGHPSTPGLPRCQDTGFFRWSISRCVATCPPFLYRPFAAGGVFGPRVALR